MKSIIFTLAAVMVATVHAVRTNTLEKGASNWNDPNSYVDKSFIPGKQDVVFVQDQSTNFIYATDSASLDVVTNLSAIILKGQGKSSSLIIDVPEGMTNLLHCPVYGDGVYASTSWESGELVKRGSGWLDLISIGKSNRGFGADYYTSINVENGTLRLPQTCNNDDGTEKAQYCQVGYVTIGSSSIFIPARYPGNSARGVTYLMGLSGGGTLQGNPDFAYWFIVKGVSPYGPFSGKVVDYVLPRIENGGMLELTGIESTGFKCNAHRINNGTLAAVKFGNKQETSSLGYTQILQVDENGGRLIYLGKGETSNRDFQLIPVNKPFYLDGGPHGGLVLTGVINNYVDSKHPEAMRGMVFTGSNETTCVFAGSVNLSHLFLNNVNYTLYMAKEGSGTWRFADNPQRVNANGFAVREGTLQFDSLLEAGLVCSLGTSTNLTDGYMGVYDANRKKDYAFNLGGVAASGAANEPTFEYTGGTGVVCTTRPIVLSGNAKIKNDTARSFRFRGVSGIGSGNMILTLDGTNNGQNEIADISDGTSGGRVGIKKTGSGTWRLSGDLTFTGDISVQGGKLVAANTKVYSWYRWTIKKVVEDPGRNVYCEEFGLFDACNVRQNIGLTVTNHISEIQPGQVSTEFPVDSYNFMATTGSSTPGPGTLDAMFNHKQDYGMWVQKSFSGDRRDWLSITMRLTNGTPEIASFDYVYPYKNPSSHAPKKYTLEGSVNGLNWDELYVTNSACSPHNNTFRWQATGGGLVSSTYEHAGGFPIRGHSLRDFEVLKNAGTIFVSGGGEFEVEGSAVEVRNVAVDAASGGTIRNVKFPEAGALDVVGAGDDSSFELPLSLEDCEGVDNIAKWTLSLGGEPTKKKIAVNNGVVHVVAPGMTMVIR